MEIIKVPVIKIKLSHLPQSPYFYPSIKLVKSLAKGQWRTDMLLLLTLSIFLITKTFWLLTSLPPICLRFLMSARLVMWNRSCCTLQFLHYLSFYIHSMFKRKQAFSNHSSPNTHLDITRAWLRDKVIYPTLHQSNRNKKLGPLLQVRVTSKTFPNYCMSIELMHSAYGQECWKICKIFLFR